MAYNKRFLLKRIVEIQNIVLKEKKKGTFQKKVYEDIIAPRYFISYATFNNYLSRNAKRELKELDSNYVSN